MPNLRHLVASAVLSVCTATFAQGTSDYGFEYFNTVGRVIGEVKAIPWTAEICSDAFPEAKASIEVALSNWLVRNRAAIATLDTQFDVIQKYWSSLPARDRRGQQSKQEMVDQLNAQRPVLKRNLETGDQLYFKKVCSVYAQALHSRRMDIDLRWSAQMAIIRKGPR